MFTCLISPTIIPWLCKRQKDCEWCLIVPRACGVITGVLKREKERQRASESCRSFQSWWWLVVMMVVMMSRGSGGKGGGGGGSWWW